MAKCLPEGAERKGWAPPTAAILRRTTMPWATSRFWGSIWRTHSGRDGQWEGQSPDLYERRPYPFKGATCWLIISLFITTILTRIRQKRDATQGEYRRRWQRIELQSEACRNALLCLECSCVTIPHTRERSKEFQNTCKHYLCMNTYIFLCVCVCICTCIRTDKIKSSYILRPTAFTPGP